MKEEAFSLHGESPTATKLLRILLASTIIDDGGSMQISRKAMAELSENVLKYRGFHLVAYPGEDNNMELSIEWY